MMRLLPVCVALLVLGSPAAGADITGVCVSPGIWLDPASGGKIAPGTVIGTMAARPVVLLGETHTAAEDHRWQLHTLAALHGRQPNMVLGFEAFPRSVQPVLDRWTRGRLGEAEFLKQSRWNEVWGYDAELYLPLFHFARMHRIPMLALNVEKSLITKVRRDGWPAVPEAERQGVSTPAPPGQAYLKFLAGVYALHSQGDKAGRKPPPTAEIPDTPEFSGFVQAQITWDRAMAEKLAQARLSGGRPLVVGIVGRGHLEYGYGITRQLADLGIDDAAVLLPWPADQSCGELKSEQGVPVAAAVFGVGRALAPAPAGRPKLTLGVFIEAAAGGVGVTRVVEGSVAEATGLAKDDIILFAAGVAVARPGQLVAIIRRQAPGTWLPLTVRRADQVLDLTARFPPP